MPPGLRTQVLRLVSSDAPGAVAHRASVAKRADMSGPGGFPKPLDPPKSAWWQARTVQGAAAAAVVVAAAVLVILAVTGAFGTHHGQLSALSHGTSSASAGPGSSGGTASASPPGGAGWQLRQPGKLGQPGRPGKLGERHRERRARSVALCGCGWHDPGGRRPLAIGAAVQPRSVT